MLYDIVNTKGEKLPDNHGFENTPGPVFLFIGSLFNLAGYANDEPLRTFMNRFSTEGKEKAQAFYIQEKVVTAWDEKCLDIYLFGKEGKIPRASLELAHAVFLPVEIMKRLAMPAGSPAFNQALLDLKNNFSRITLMGYSAGTAIIRQMEACVVAELEKAGLTDKQIESVVSCGVAVDIGSGYPVPESPKTLTHLTTNHRDDMMVNKIGEIFGGYDYPAPDKGKALTAEKRNNTILLVPEIGSGTVRAVFRDPQKPSEQSVLFQEHQEKHSLFMYTNKKETMKIEGKLMDTHPSLPTGKLVREFNAAAIGASAVSVRNGLPRNGPALLKSFERVNMSSRRLRRLEKVFRRNERYFEQYIAAGIKPDFVPSFWIPPDFAKDLAAKDNKPAPPAL